MEKAIKKSRIWEIDFLRGLAIILMILDHFCYDLNWLPSFFKNFYEIDNSFVNFLYYDIAPIYSSDIRLVFHVIFVAIFLMLVGISCHFSKNNLLRGSVLLIVQLLFGTVMQIASSILETDVSVWFGILYVISLSILMTALIDFILKNIKIKKYVYLILGLALVIPGFFFSTYAVSNYVNEITIDNFFLIVIGKYAFGADYFALFFNMGFVFIGKFLGETLYNERKSLIPKLNFPINKPFCFVGRHSLYFYIFHQVIIILFIGILMLSLGYQLNF